MTNPAEIEKAEKQKAKKEELKKKADNIFSEKFERGIIPVYFDEESYGHERALGIAKRKEMGKYDFGKPPFPDVYNVTWKPLEINLFHPHMPKHQ